MRPVLKIRGIIFKSLCLPNPVTSSESDSNTSLCAHFSLYNPVLSCRSSEEHYYIVKYTNIDLFSPWELTWEGLSVCVCVCDEGLTDVWCAGAWLYTLRWIHPRSMYPQVYVMWVLRNLGNVGKPFIPPTRHSCVLIMHHLIWIFSDRLCLDWVCHFLHQPKCPLIVRLMSHLVKMYKFF